MNSSRSYPAAPWVIAVVGLGAVGRLLVELLARHADICRMILVDPDHYEVANLGYQAITAECVDQLKVVATARRVAQLNPDIALDLFPLPVADVPLGAMRCDLIFSCPDALCARQDINFIATRLGIPWIDAAVDAARCLRVRFYPSSSMSACLECGWHAEDYARLEQAWPCGPLPRSPASGTAIEVSTMAAGLAVDQGRQYLMGQPTAEQQVYIDLRNRQLHINCYSRNAGCLLGHHRLEARPLGESAQAMSISALLGLSGCHAEIEIVGQQFVTELSCPHCVRTCSRVPLLRRALRRHPEHCMQCGGELLATGLQAQRAIALEDIPEACRLDPLSRFGLSDGDIAVLHTAEAPMQHLEIGAPHAQQYS